MEPDSDWDETAQSFRVLLPLVRRTPMKPAPQIMSAPSKLRGAASGRRPRVLLALQRAAGVYVATACGSKTTAS